MQIMYLHPVWQMAMSALALYVMWLGWARARSLHLGYSTPFKRKRHVFLGQVAMYGWLAGAAGGMALAWDYWGGWLKTGVHAWVGICMSALIVWGLASGLYMARRPKKRKNLALLHGLGNVALIGLAAVQSFSGDALLDQLKLDL